MFIVGLTGGIGSGKSAVSDLFATLGVTIVDADIISRVVVAPGRPALQKIAEHFGSEILQADGTLDRAQLRKLIFADDNERKWLEGLLHPLMGEETIYQLENAASPYAILVSPLLFETGQNFLCDRVLTVDAPEALQLERTMTRDNNSEQQVKAIMATQADRQQRLEKSDDVIVNDGSLTHLAQKVGELDQTYLTLAKKKLST